MKTRTSRLISLAVLGVVASGLAACGGSDTDDGDVEPGNVAEGTWEEVVAAAEDEGRVNLYSVAPPVQNDRLVAAFREEHPGIQVNVTRGAGELPGRVEAEISSGVDGADVFLYTDPQFFVNISDDLLDVDGPSVEGWKDDFWVVEGKSILATAYPWTTLVWNTEIFPDGFENWDDLLAPDVEGSLAVYKEPTTSTVATMTWMEANLGVDFIEQLGQQSPAFYPSTIPMAQAIASGERGVGYLLAPATAFGLQDEGAPVDIAYPDPGFALAWGGGAIGTSDRPNAARLFLDFVMSEAGQTAINGDGYGASGRDGIEGAIDELEGWELYDSSEVTPERTAEMETKLAEWFG